MRLPLCVAFIAVVLVVACSESSTPAPGGSGGDAGGPASSSGSSGSSNGSSGGEDVDAGTDAGATLTPAKKTDAKVTINAVARTLERSQFGVTSSDDSLYL